MPRTTRRNAETTLPMTGWTNSEWIPTISPWFRSTKNWAVRTGPIVVCPLAYSTLLTLPACSAVIICSLIFSEACGKVNDQMSQHQAVLNHSAPTSAATAARLAPVVRVGPAPVVRVCPARRGLLASASTSHELLLSDQQKSA